MLVTQANQHIRRIYLKNELIERVYKRKGTMTAPKKYIFDNEKAFLLIK